MGDVMKTPRKVDLEDMALETLELEKQRLFEKLLNGCEPKKHRNILYEVLGVIDFKRRFEARGS